MPAHKKIAKVDKAESKAKKTSDVDLVQIADFPVRRGDDYRSIYANNATVASAFYEYTIVFGEIMAGPSPFVEEKVRVVMNPAHAKALALAILVNLKRWERNFGVIKFPEGLIPPETVEAVTSSE